MNWIIVLLAVYLVLGLRGPGRMGSTYVSILVASALVIGWAYLRPGG